MMPGRVHVVRDLDLSTIGAVGFDLDHTLAVYDDARVNALAYEETREFLVERGYAPSLMRGDYDEASVCRGLLIDTASACLLKADGEGRVRRAARWGRQLGQREIRECYPSPAPGLDGLHGINTPFDLPTAFLFHQLATAETDASLVCSQIRYDLDRAHTRGDLKRRILADVDSLVRPLGTPARAIAQLRDAGKRLFVLTNSEAPYTIALLDRLYGGGSWRDLFCAVVTHANKPGFFGATAHEVRTFDDSVVVGATAKDLETIVGVGGDRVLYLGDSVKADTRPARAFGWRTAHVVQELSASAFAGPWGSPLFENDRPTWFAKTIVANADLYLARVEDFLQIPHDASLVAKAHPLAP